GGEALGGDRGDGAILARHRGQLALDRAGGLVQLLQQVRGDGQAVAAGQGQHLVHRAERGAHDDGGGTALLELLVHAADELHARVLVDGRRDLAARLVPVEDAADEGRDQERDRKSVV